MEANKKQGGQYILKGFIKDTKFCFFGARHLYDPNDAQWNLITSEWNDFLKDNTKEVSVILEGTGEIPFMDVDGDDLISRFGEVGYMAKKAMGYNAKIIWNEMTTLEEASLLKQSQDNDLVNYFMFARMTGSCLRSKTFSSFNETVNKVANAINRRLGINQDFNYFNSIHLAIFGNALDESQEEIICKASAPIYFDSIINEISRESGVIRDTKLENSIEKEISDNRSVFVLYGEHHAHIIEKKFREKGELD